MSQAPQNVPDEPPPYCSSSPIGRREFRSLVLNYLVFVCSAGLILLMLLSPFFIWYLFINFGVSP